MGTYIVGDIHGCFSKWMTLKNLIESQDADAKFILLGDIVDRGSEVKEMLEWAMSNITEAGKYQMVRGNHEHMKIRWWGKTFKDRPYYLKEDYGFDKFVKKVGYSRSEIDSIIRFFSSLPILKELTIKTNEKETRYIITHGGVPRDLVFDDSEFDISAIDMTSNYIRESFLWERNYHGYGWSSRTVVVHGHTPTGCDELVYMGAVLGRIDYRRRDINIDVGAVFDDTIPLAAIRLEDLQEFYSCDFDVDDSKELFELNKRKDLLFDNWEVFNE